MNYENVTQLCPTSPNSRTELSLYVGKDIETDAPQFVTLNKDFPLALVEGNPLHLDEMQTLMYVFASAYYNKDRVSIIPTKVGEEGLDCYVDIIEKRLHVLRTEGRRTSLEYNQFQPDDSAEMQRVLGFVRVSSSGLSARDMVQVNKKFEIISKLSRSAGVHVVVLFEGTLQPPTRHFFDVKMYKVNSELLWVNEGGSAFECVAEEIV